MRIDVNGAGHTLRRTMIPTLTALLQTITGKVVLGLTVATASVGAAAAGVPVPIVQELVPGAEHAAVSEGRPADTTSDDNSEPDAEADGSEPEAPAAAATAVGAGAAVVGDEAEEGAADEPNHGEVVSEFATTTELEGCERGQAVSAVARGELDPQTDTFDADLTTYLDELDKCNDTEVAAETAETTDEEPAEEGARGGPPADKPAGKSAERGNRPDHAGNGKP